MVTRGAETSVVLQEQEGRVGCARLWVHWHWVQVSRIKWQVVVSYLAGEGELTVGDRRSLGGVKNSSRVFIE